ncbi:MAG TPA: FAD-dependent oxidoreductase, partial [Candidatus Angelobacter sp.]
MKVWDVIISGAGIIGVSLALEVRERGAAVLVLDRGEPGREASSAAAGMLAATDPETPEQLRPLAYAGARLYPRFVEKLEHLSAVKTDFRRGAIALLPNAMVPPEHRLLSAAELRGLEPGLNPGRFAAAIADNENSVDPDLLMRA